MTPEKVLRNFNRCKDWEERYLYLIELGERLKPYPPSKLNDRHIVQGCQSQVWVDFKVDNEGVVTITATSDSAIVKGLLSLVCIAFSGKHLDEIASFDVIQWFDELNLKSHLTPGRTQGLEAIIRTVKTHCDTNTTTLDIE